MSSRAPASRERERELAERVSKRPRIADTFRDLKRGLATVSAEEWESLPESMDLSRRNRLLSREREKAHDVATAAPDTLLRDRAAAAAAAASAPSSSSAPSDLTTLGRARDSALSVRLDRASDSVSGQTVVDPRRALADIVTLQGGGAELGDVHKARKLLDSLVATNPGHPPAWIARARLEAECGRLLRARQIMARGCRACPRSEDAWAEAARLAGPGGARAILLEAVRHLPRSVDLWLRARDLETAPEARRAVLRRALDLVPNSARLWKAAVEEEADGGDARVMLSRAVECVPESVDMWLALARLETYANARKVINRARRALPREPAVWVAAARLEEANGNEANVRAVAEAAVRAVPGAGRDRWLDEAEGAERGGSPRTCRELVRAAIGEGVDARDRLNRWLSDARRFVDRGSPECARAAYARVHDEFPRHSAAWMLAARLERAHGAAAQEALLARATAACPASVALWLTRAKSAWKDAGDVPLARRVLEDAFAACPDSEEVWLAAAKLESESGAHGRAEALLARAREHSGTARVWQKSAQLQRRLGAREAEGRTLTEATGRFPRHAKLWMMLGQCRGGEARREAFCEGLRHCPSSVPLWLCLVAHDAAAHSLGRARATLEAARARVPRSAPLWLAAARVEQANGDDKAAGARLAKGLQECPGSGALWAHSVAAQPRALRKGRAFDALRACEGAEAAPVLAAVARIFWEARKAEKAREWFERAVAADPDFGDAWAFYAAFEERGPGGGDPARAEEVCKRCVAAAPRHGERWVAFSKDPTLEVTPDTAWVLRRAAESVRAAEDGMLFELFGPGAVPGAGVKEA